jgi:hypothetical protein
MKLLGILGLLAVATFAQSPDSSGYVYEERPAVGLYYELTGELQNVSATYRIMRQNFNVDVTGGPTFGVGAQLPVYPYLGINGIVGIQQIIVDYNIQSSNAIQQMMLGDRDSTFVLAGDTTPQFGLGLTSDDLNGQMLSRNLIIQAGAELGYPVYSDYKSDFMIKPYAFGSGILGKTFFDDSKFKNTTLWGYAYGAGVRIAWRSVAVEAGVRASHTFWQTYFDPSDMTGEQATDDEFMLDYDTPISPFVKAVYSLY